MERATFVAKQPEVKGLEDFSVSTSGPESAGKPRPKTANLNVEELINHYAHVFHLKLGGSEGDWDEERENSVKYEMFRRWRESPWGRLWRGRKDSSNAHGCCQTTRALSKSETSSASTRTLNRLQETFGYQPALRTVHTEEGLSISRQALYGGPSTSTGDTLMTAHSHISPEPETVLPVFWYTFAFYPLLTATGS